MYSSFPFMSMRLNALQKTIIFGTVYIKRIFNLPTRTIHSIPGLFVNGSHYPINESSRFFAGFNSAVDKDGSFVQAKVPADSFDSNNTILLLP